MRQFELVNELGQTFSLNDIKTGFMQNPKGLGYSMQYAYQKIGSYWKELYMRDEQSKITAEVVFGTTSPYEAQTSFLEFIRVSTKITLKRTTAAGIHLKDVKVVEYDITEITDGNVLSCPITMVAQSLWYQRTSAKVNIINADTATRYSYTFPSPFSDFSDGYLTVVNDGSINAAFTAEIYGAIANPVLAIEENSVEISRVAIPTSISSGERLIYSSKDGDLYCYKGTAEQIEGFKRNGVTTGLTNVVLSFSLSNDNFPKFPTGTSTLHATADGVITNPIWIEVFKQYRAV